MERQNLAFGLKRGRVDGEFRWFKVANATTAQDGRAADPRKTARGILIAIPLALAIWIGLALLLLL